MTSKGGLKPMGPQVAGSPKPPTGGTGVNSKMMRGMQQGGGKQMANDGPDFDAPNARGTQGSFDQPNGATRGGIPSTVKVTIHPATHPIRAAYAKRPVPTGASSMGSMPEMK